jgi:hypothetical protein
MVPEVLKKRILVGFRSTILKPVEDERIRHAIVTANNQHAGFGPATLNLFRNILALPEATWQDEVLSSQCFEW